MMLKHIILVLSHKNNCHTIFFRWEDGNNLTSNLFTLINNTGLLQHTKKNTPDIHACSYKPYTEKKTRRKINNNNNIKKKKIEKNTKAVRYVQ